jgi:hypothetical protein
VRHPTAVRETGLDRHEWETEWQGLGPLVADSLADSLPELDGGVRMLDAHGLSLDEKHEFESPEEEVAKEFLERRGVTRLVEAGERVDPADFGAPVAGYRNLHDCPGERYVAWAHLRRSAGGCPEVAW